MPPYNVYSPYNYSLGVNTNLGLPNYSQTVNDYNNLALQNQVQKALNLSLQTPNIGSSTTGVANAGLQTTGIQPNTPTGSVAGVDPTMAMISLGAGISNTANDLIYGMQDPMHKDYIFDVAQRGTKEDGHVLNSFADLMFTGNGLWGESSAEREIKEGVEHARDIAYDLGNTFNNANSVESILNIDANTKMPELLTAKSPMSDNGRSMEAAEEINPILRQGYKDFITGRNNQLKNIAQRNQRQQFMNMFANGGSLDELNGITKFNVGGSHSENPYEGIQQGIASDGNPNLVEEGEVKYKDYIYSARLKPNKSLLKEFNLPDKYTGKTFAEVADILQKESEDRPNDPISLQTLDDWMSRLAGAQEEYKAKAEQRRLAKAIDSMSDEEKAAIMSSLVQSMPQQEGIDLSQPMYASGGKIHIKPENRGKFTALKKRTGKSATWFKQHGTPAQKKMANFALNARKWKHEDGGHLFPDGGYPWEVGYIYGNDIYNNRYTKPIINPTIIPTTITIPEGNTYIEPVGVEEVANPYDTPWKTTSTKTTPDTTKGTVNTDLLTQRFGELLRGAPVAGSFEAMMRAAIQPKDFSVGNTDRQLAAQIGPIGTPRISGFETPHLLDPNLTYSNNLAILARQLDDVRRNPVLTSYVVSEMQKKQALDNFNWQQANNAERQRVATNNLGINKFNAQLTQADNQLNNARQIAKLNLLEKAALADDASKEAWANMYNTTRENFFNQLGNVDRDKWNRGQFLLWLKERPAIDKEYGITV